MGERKYIAIDLKSFYASVECIERGFDPMRFNLVVADESKTEKTICLAVSPSLKAYGIPGRARLFEVVQKVKEVNAGRKRHAPNRTFAGSSYIDTEVQTNPALALDYFIAPPRMAHYMEYSTRIYNIYQEFIAPEDIHVYSIDEVMMDVTDYLASYKLTARELAAKMIREVYKRTGITATAGVGTNLYLCKVAMDIVAKHMPPDENGVRIAELDEMGYRKLLWSHRPLTDFWRVGRGYAEKLEAHAMYTMGDVARCSLRNEDLLYKLFGVNAELLIDHAWGWEPCTIAEVKAYQPSSNSLGSGQVLQQPYNFEKGKLIVREMTDALVLDLVEKGFKTNQIVLTVGYDIENLTDSARRESYHGEITIDRYGRKIPKHAHGTANLKQYTSSTRLITDAAMELYERIVDKNLLVRRMYVVANRVVRQDEIPEETPRQLDLFTDYEAEAKRQAEEEAEIKREENVQKAVISIQKKFGKNALIKGMNMEEGATTVERNGQVGGHKK
ncbi:MAG: DNA methylase [Clostridia bacterium]|nr:DNA methylase [Clostridia bacterium]